MSGTRSTALRRLAETIVPTSGLPWRRVVQTLKAGWHEPQARRQIAARLRRVPHGS